MRKPCKTKRCSDLAVVGRAYCLACRRRRRQHAGHRVCTDWSIYAVACPVLTTHIHLSTEQVSDRRMEVISQPAAVLERIGD